MLLGSPGIRCGLYFQVMPHLPLTGRESGRWATAMISLRPGGRTWWILTVFLRCQHIWRGGRRRWQRTDQIWTAGKGCCQGCKSPQLGGTLSISDSIWVNPRRNEERHVPFLRSPRRGLISDWTLGWPLWSTHINTLRQRAFRSVAWNARPEIPRASDWFNQGLGTGKLMRLSDKIPWTCLGRWMGSHWE